MKHLIIKAGIVLTLGWGSILVVLWLFDALNLDIGISKPQIARAASRTVCLTGPPTCDYDTIQVAVDDANDGDVIKVATGTYTDVQSRAGITQVVYISKTITIRGGYTTNNWTISNPEVNPVTLNAQGQGRVLFITGNVSPTIEGLRITGGDAKLGGGISGNAGGGVYVITASVTLGNNQVFSNTAGVGGGLYFSNSASSMLVTNTVSQNNSVGISPRGGGLYFINSPNAILADNTIISNTATLISSSKHGGGIYCQSSDNMTLMANVIRGNDATNSGGGLHFLNCDNIKLTANVISNNKGAHGGGLRIESSADIELTDNMISSNNANRAGGGADFETSHNVTLIGNTIMGNDASPVESIEDFGAGLRFISSTNVNLVSNIVINNHTVALGGGLYMDNSDVTMTNNLITANQVNTAGSGIFIANSAPHLLHTTLTHNSGGDGSGVYITGAASTTALTNTILSSHTIGITVVAGNMAILNGVLWHNNISNTGGAGIVTIMQDHIGDPAFAPDGYHLTFSSEAIGKGVDAGVTMDIDSDHRPCDLTPDLGADEISCRYLPLILKNKR